MSLQVSLKLKLSKQIKKIKVKYNTFEKATYDEYLIASLVLRTTGKINGEKNAFEYIDDITGEGSLNAHFKNIYNRLKSFSEEKLNKIMESSMIPTLKIDEKNRYGYYPQLNVSIFNGKIYQGDLGEYSNLKEIIMIQEEIIEMGVDVVLMGDEEKISLGCGHVKFVPQKKGNISLVPYGERVHIINSKGLEYPLDDLVLTKNDTRGISNLSFADEVEFFVKEGQVLILETWRPE